MLSNGLFAQSFSCSLSPSTQIITQGDSTEFNIQITPVGGFNASVYFLLPLPNCLIGSTSLSASSGNSPYSGLKIKISNSSTIPVGTHEIILKSYNGSLVEYDTCKLTINASGSAHWQIYKSNNAPLYVDNVRSTAIDASGNFWIGTIKGIFTGPGALVCFDKNKWYSWSQTEFKITDLCGTTESSSPINLSGDGISSICVQGDTVYASSYNEIYMLINKTLTKITPPVLNSNDNIHTLRLDPQKNLWAATYYGLYKYDGANWTAFNFSGTPATAPGAGGFDFDNNGNLWIAAGGLHKYDGALWTTYGVASGIPALNITAISKADNGTIWAGTQSNGTIYKFSSVTNSFTPKHYSSSGNGIAYSITYDKNSNPIVGTEIGLFVFDGLAWTTYSAQNSPVQANTMANVVAIPWTASMDQNNNLIVANGSGGFLIKSAQPSVITNIPNHSEVSDYFELFPNPSEGKITISNKNNENFDLTVDDLNGKAVFKQKNQQTSIDVSLPAGIYFAILSDNSQKVFSKKIYIMK